MAELIFLLLAKSKLIERTAFVYTLHINRKNILEPFPKMRDVIEKYFLLSIVVII